jgi:hypothetical protein
MPIIYMSITNNKDLITRSLRESYVALNGRLKNIDTKINLAKENENFKHKTWILPFNDND